MFDVIIVGGGLVGSCTALSIKKANSQLRIAVIEAFAANDDAQPSFDDRSIAVAEQSANYLKQYDLLDTNAEYCVAIDHVAVSDKGHFGKTYIDKAEYNVDALGYVVEVRPWGRFLHRQLEQMSVSLFCPNNVTALTQTSDNVTIELNTGELIQARLIIAADGAHSKTLEKLKIETITQAYQQGAIIANVEVADGHSNCAFERFTKHGPMAMLPMSKNRYSLVWCVEPDSVESLMSCSENEFLSQLQQEFGYRAGHFTKVGMRANYPLVVGKPERLIHHRVAILGNAAHIVHPIAGQGFNLGLRDIISLTQLISNAAKAGQDIGDIMLLNQYQVERNQDIKTVLWLTDALVRSFSNESRVIAFARSLTLSMMNGCSVLKAPLAKRLMGYVE